MSISCPSSAAIVLQQCTPECTRWTSVNQSQPVRYFHDKTQWDPQCYKPPNSVAIDEADPQVYLDQAIAIWETDLPAGYIFTEVSNSAQADFIIQYQLGDGTVAGDALCACDADDDVCVRQVDHNSIFGPGNASTLNIYCNGPSGNGYGSVNAFINLYAHELGHMLGMGHVRNQNPPVTSVMGNPANGNSQLVLYSFDREQRDARYPYNCVITSPSRAFVTQGITTHLTSTHCPYCLCT